MDYITYLLPVESNLLHYSLYLFFGHETLSHSYQLTIKAWCYNTSVPHQVICSSKVVTVIFNCFAEKCNMIMILKIIKMKL